MNVRVACSWIREQLIGRAQHRLTVGTERAAEEDAVYADAVAEVDEFLDPPPFDVGEADPWGDAGWVAAMGGEMAPVV